MGKQQPEQDSVAVQQDSVHHDTIVSAPGRPFRFTDTEIPLVADTVTEVAEDTADVISSPLEGYGLFRSHVLKPVHQNARPLNNTISDWFTISLLALVALFTWFRYFYNRIFGQILGAWFNITTTNQIVRDESILLQRASLFISVISYLLAGLFLYQVTVYYDWRVDWLPRGIGRFVILSAAVATAYTFKMLMLRFFAVVFGQEKAAALYIFNIFLMVMMGGLLLLPVNVLMAYAPYMIRQWVILAAVIILGVMFLYRLVRATAIWVGIPGFSFFYLFLYLCAFEIAPLLIVWKLTSM